MAVRPNPDGHRPFVGRARELAVAAEILTDSDRTGVVLIGGESGLGKTRLAAKIVETAPENTVVIRGGAVPRATPIPFELVGSTQVGRDPGGPNKGASESAGASASASASASAGANEGDEGSERADPVGRIRAEAEALRNVDHLRTTNDEPLIYVFEDVHWADAESLEVIERLMVTGPLGASILITYRPNALHPGHPTSTFLQRAERRSNVVQFRLEPLRREEVEAYLGAAGRPVDAATVEHVHSRTGGNPLLVSELVAAVMDDADLAHGLPWTLAEMLRPEIERLPRAERSVAEAVAVLGTEVDFDLLAAAVDLMERELLEHLRSLVEKGILLETGPDRFGFRHDLVREAVADGLFTREHRRIHAAVHDALLAVDSDDVVALVAHATGAGRTKQAADAARDAAREAMQDGRSHQALAFAEQALLEHTDDLELLRIAVVTGWMTDQDRTALHHLERWEELIGSDPTDRAEVLHHRVRLQWERGDSDAADRAAEELNTLADSMDDGVPLVQALADLAQHHMLRARELEAIALADRAIAVAAEVGSAADDAALQARAERASALIGSDGGAARTAAIHDLLAVAAEAEISGHHIVASRAMNNTPIQHLAVDARAHVERMRRVSERAGMSCMAEDNYRRSLLYVARLDGDREAFESQLEAALEDLGHVYKIDMLAAALALEEAQYIEARLAAENLPLYLESARYSVSWREGLLALTDLLETGDAEPFQRWLADLPAEQLAQYYALELILIHLSDLLAAGLQSALQEFLAREVVDQTFEPAYLGIRAELGERLEEAEALYAEAIAAGMCRTVSEQTELHLARARVAELQSVGSGRRHLEDALTRLTRWPGRRRDQVMAMLGQQDTGSESSQTLTPREREVAALVTRGLTNGGIAEELFISTKTASVHVSNILAKRNMTSRTEIATWVAEGGLD